jgi:hypothetical protein
MGERERVLMGYGMLGYERVYGDCFWGNKRKMVSYSQ